MNSARSLNSCLTQFRVGLLSRSCVVSILSLGTFVVGAQETDESPAIPESDDRDEPMEELVAVGMRHQSRSVLESTVPVDIYTPEDIDSVQSSDLIEVMSLIAPSFSVRRQPISDGASFVRPTHIRNLQPHHTLVLINHKRRHKSAFMQVGGWGAHGADIGSIPSIAIESIEVLRDGAAAQYGSDAIAGVVNFNLRNNPDESLFRARIGQYAAGDGTEFTLEGTHSFRLGKDGVLTLSAQTSDAEPTSRSQPYDLSIGSSGVLPHEAIDDSLTIDGRTYYGPDALTYFYNAAGEVIQILPGSDGIPDDLDTRFADNFDSIGGDRTFARPAQIWGQPSRKQYLTFLNVELPTTGKWAFHGFANFSQKDQTGGFFYRRPGINTLLPLRLEDGAIYDPRESLYPAGFTPQFSGFVTERSGSFGLRRELSDLWTVDASLTSGNSKVEYSIANTLNPSLGPRTPTAFKPGNIQNEEVAFNVDFVGTVSLGASRPIGLALGAERRIERYTIESVDLKSYELGPFGVVDPFNFEITQAEVDADPNDAWTVIQCRIPGFEAIGSLCPEGDPIHNAVPIGSNGFPGYSPLYESITMRKSAGVYFDAEMDLTDSWLFNSALRLEEFDDFGSVAVWKVASKIAVGSGVNLRGSMGTGFRAPSTGQLSTTNVSTRISPSGIPEAVGLFPATHPASQLFGSQTLQPEDSLAVTLGMTVDSRRLGAITLDAYQVKLDDRLILASGFTVGPEERQKLLALQVPGALDLGRVSFFTNDVDTTTTGIDLTGNFDFETDLGNTSVHWLINYNRTSVSNRGRYVNAEGAFDIENGTPSQRVAITVRHAWRSMDFSVRLRHYGGYENASNATLEDIQEFSAELFLDASATWNIANRTTWRIGAENLFDNYPDPGRFEACCGRIYRSDSTVPWQGAMIYSQFEFALN